jgi:acyl-CoA thioester hydrolase
MNSIQLDGASAEAAHAEVQGRGPDHGGSWADSAGLEMSAYPVRRILQTRVSDLDGYGHLNAIRLGHFYEDARAAFHMSARREGGRVVVAQLTLRYLAEGSWPGEAEVGTGIVRIGRSSFVMGQGLFQDGGRIGACETVLVHTLEGRSSPLPDGYRAALLERRLFGLQT